MVYRRYRKLTPGGASQGASGDPLFYGISATTLLRYFPSEQSLVHGGILGIGLLFCLRGLSNRGAWSDKLLALTFWSLNIGLAIMVFMSPVPAGVYQAWASISEGVWFARSPAFVHSSLMETFVWLRVLGDIVFALGTLFLALFAGRLLIVRRNLAAVASANAFAGKTM